MTNCCFKVAADESYRQEKITFIITFKPRNTFCRRNAFPVNEIQIVLQCAGCIIAFLRSIAATRESNQNGRFSAQLELVKLICGREIDVV